MGSQKTLNNMSDMRDPPATGRETINFLIDRRGGRVTGNRAIFLGCFLSYTKLLNC
jgi:hypothetical protein